MTRKKVEIFLLGGLGNQLFGWAAGFSLAKKLDCGLKINVSQLSTRSLSIPDRILNDTEISRDSSLYYESKSKLLKQFLRNIPFNTSYFEKEFSFENRFNKISRPVKLYGYFQSHEYFADFNLEILRILDDELNFTNDAKEIRAKLPDRFISIHFRRGDYVNNSDFHPLATKEYYERALHHVRNVGMDYKIVVFTDDVSLAQEVFPTDLILSQRDLSDPFDNMYLMSKGEAIIGANSSFSLWAGFLLSARGGTCIFPNRWFGSGRLKDLTPVPPEFIQF